MHNTGTTRCSCRTAGAEGAVAVPARKMPARHMLPACPRGHSLLGPVLHCAVGAKVPCWPPCGVKHLIPADLQQRWGQFIVNPPAPHLLSARMGFRQRTSFLKNALKSSSMNLTVSEKGDWGILSLCTLVWKANQCIKPLKEGLLWR